MNPSSPHHPLEPDLPPAAHTTHTRTKPANNHFEVPPPCLSTSTPLPRIRAETPRATTPSRRASQASTRLWWRVARQCLFPIWILRLGTQVLLGEQIFFLCVANSALFLCAQHPTFDVIASSSNNYRAPVHLRSTWLLEGLPDPFQALGARQIGPS